ncbi:hypothetical protein Trydic_g21899 [Trypoxylus dichotomus]
MFVEREWHQIQESRTGTVPEPGKRRLVQETWLRKRGSVQYRRFRYDQKRQRRVAPVEVAILIRSGWCYRAIPLNPEVEAGAIETMVHGRLTTLVSAYNRASRKLKTEDLGGITSVSRTLVAGDLNAKSQHWNSRTQNPNRKGLWRWLLSNNDVAIVGPEDLTSCPHNGSRGDVIDILIAKRIGIKGIRVVHAIHPDLFSVLAELGEGRTSSTAPPKKTNWMKFTWLSSKLNYEDRDLREGEIETAAQNL